MTDTKQPPKQQNLLTHTPLFQAQKKSFKKIFTVNGWDKHGGEKRENNEKL